MADPSEEGRPRNLDARAFPRALDLSDQVGAIAPRLPTRYTAPMHRLVTVALYATAALNLLGALLALIGADFVAGLLYTAPIDDPLLLRHHQLLWLFVGAMGVGYGVAARDPARQTALLVSGALGKLAAALLWTEMYASGLATPFIFSGILWDGPLAVLFAVFLATKVRRTP